MKHLTLTLCLALSLIALLSALSPRQPTAFAEISGPCEATVNGVDAGGLSSTDPGDAIEVEKDDVIDVQLTGQAPFRSHKIDMEIAGITFNIEDDPEDSDPVVTEQINVDDYASYGVGLYKVKGTAVLADGTTCSGAVLIQIKGSPFGTAIGLAATAALVLGAAFLGGGAIFASREMGRTRRRVNEWSDAAVARVQSGQQVSPDELAAEVRGITSSRKIVSLWLIAAFPALMLIGASMPGGTGGMRPSQALSSMLKLPRLSWLPRLSALGTVGGIMTTEAVLVLLQQFAITPLTGSNAVAGLAMGLVLAVGVTSTVRWWGGREVNKAIADAEQRLNEAIAALRTEAGLPPTTGGAMPQVEPPSAPHPVEPPPESDDASPG